MVVDRNRVDVVIESGLLHSSPQRRGIGRRAETNLLGSKAARGGREKRTDLFDFLTGGGGFAAGGRGFAAGGGGFAAGGGGIAAGGGGIAAGGGGRLGGLPWGGGKAGDTFTSEKTGFNLSTEMLFC